jgi:hypothetical protein
MMIWTVTADDARDAGATLERYADELRIVLEPYGVAVEPAPDMGGPGGLRGCADATLAVDIRQAVARMRSAGPETLAEINQDRGMTPRR